MTLSIQPRSSNEPWVSRFRWALLQVRVLGHLSHMGLGPRADRVFRLKLAAALFDAVTSGELRDSVVIDEETGFLSDASSRMTRRW